MTPNKKKLTIIIPTYNVEHYIVNSIKSVLLQDSNDYCLIIIDDKSTDNTLNLIETEFSKEIKEKKITLIALKKNVGPAIVRQIGLNNVTTPYVTFFDSDDLYESPCAVSSMIKSMEEFRADFVMFKYITDHGKIKIKKNINLPTNRLLSNKEILVNKLRSNNPIWHYLWNKCYRMEIIRKYDICFHSELKRAEDVVFNEDYLQRSNNCFFINEYLYRYNCLNSSSISKSHINITKDTLTQRWQLDCQRYEKLVEYCKRLDCLNICHKYLIKNLCNTAITIINTSEQYSWNKEIKHLIESSDHYSTIKEYYNSEKLKIKTKKIISKFKTLIIKLVKK